MLASVKMHLGPKASPYSQPLTKAPTNAAFYGALSAAKHFEMSVTFEFSKGHDVSVFLGHPGVSPDHA
jgi:hypothetical protein